jgi:radical SAM protein with 4Fe4S-binding SPASM domain
MCSSWELAKKTNKKELTTTEILKAVSEYQSAFRIELIRFVGGEPLLRNDLFDIIKKVSSTAYTEVVTNGTLINEDVATSIIESGLHRLRISVDGTKECHDFMRGKGAFLKTSKGIDLVQIKKRTAGSKFPKISIQACISNKNYKELSEMYNIAKLKDAKLEICFLADRHKEMGKTYMEGKQLGYHRLIDPGNYQLSSIEQFIFLLNYYKLNILSRDRLTTHSVIHKCDLLIRCIDMIFQTISPFYRDCIRSKNMIMIDPWGNIFPCEFLNDYTYGNCLSETPTNIWFGDKRLKLRKNIRNGSFAICKKCNSVRLHRGGSVYSLFSLLDQHFKLSRRYRI